MSQNLDFLAIMRKRSELQDINSLYRKSEIWNINSEKRGQNCKTINLAETGFHKVIIMIIYGRSHRRHFKSLKWCLLCNKKRLRWPNGGTTSIIFLFMSSQNCAIEVCRRGYMYDSWPVGQFEHYHLLCNKAGLMWMWEMCECVCWGKTYSPSSSVLRKPRQTNAQKCPRQMQKMFKHLWSPWSDHKYCQHCCW